MSILDLIPEVDELLDAAESLADIDVNVLADLEDEISDLEAEIEVLEEQVDELEETKEEIDRIYDEVTAFEDLEYDSATGLGDQS